MVGETNKRIYVAHWIHRIKRDDANAHGEYDPGFEVIPARGANSIFGAPYRITSFKETHVCPNCGAHRKPRYFPEYPTCQIEGITWFENEEIDGVDSGALCGDCGWRYAV